ncbi:8-amino-7-oxononanoate synthase [Paludibacterium paludis]|uniref:8-amino-7-oxononanoate synthase n=1 Tax=Paludibacterium paludis TaxID=1225769 RepID=A0A918U7Z3_9NEIS|nr:8-amino-7-oxononanoate synthase [Paludibacterium paludis]GGY09154.1 8-amino-7-oxononanoate synthase [Paludibacterium paludis]
MKPDEIDAALAALAGRGLFRQRQTLESAQGANVVVGGRSRIAFASNDYLGLANHPALIAAVTRAVRHYGVGGGASHLVAGHFAPHEEAETALAGFVGREASVLFSSGYLANLAVITALAGRGDAVFGDKLNHASLNDACQLSRATFRRFRHNDLDHLAHLLSTTEAAGRLIAVDAVYSMDGDEAPLAGLLELAERFDAWLYVDDAHGFGVLGDGRGSLAEASLASPRLIGMATLGKAAGVSGAFVAADRRVCQWLVNRARSYIYTTASPPALSAAVLASLEVMRGEPWRRGHVLALASRMQRELGAAGVAVLPSRTPVQAVVLGDARRALDVAAALFDEGFQVPAIRPPTVPEGTARLRVSLSAAHSEQDVDRLIGRLAVLASP